MITPLNGFGCLIKLYSHTLHSLGLRAYGLPHLKIFQHTNCLGFFQIVFNPSVAIPCRLLGFIILGYTYTNTSLIALLYVVHTLRHIYTDNACTNGANKSSNCSASHSGIMHICVPLLLVRCFILYVVCYVLIKVKWVMLSYC